MTPQLPVLSKVTVLPERLQLPFGTMVKLTGRPELAVALTVMELPTVCAGMALKVMVCEVAARSGRAGSRQAAASRRGGCGGQTAERCSWESLGDDVPCLLSRLRGRSCVV
jgi:hypothetical protein